LGRLWPAVDVHDAPASDLILAAVDDCAPTAVEERDRAVRLFFATTTDRDAALATLTRSGYAAEPLGVSDEDWARRSQQDLAPITVGRLTIFPNPQSLIPNPYSIVIAPSMGFGTGHHATTRLCLAALQTLELAGSFVLDCGTGSGVLAIAAVRLGAARALGIDSDADAVLAANENRALNGCADRVSFDVADLVSSPLPQADVVTANLTGALLVRAAALLWRAVGPGGTLIVSGILPAERAAVREAFDREAFNNVAFDNMVVTVEAEEDGWFGLAVKKP
jgi:ribosomal protein L11 methyltransferase